MRTFIALELSSGVRSQIGRLTTDLKDFLPEVRWVGLGNIHLTLRFLGEIDPRGLSGLEQAVGEAAARTESFGLELGDIGFFGSARTPRVVWLGIQSSETLAGLAAEVEKAVREAGYGHADKPFKPHLTLARIRKPLKSPPDWERIRRLAPSQWPSWPVAEVLIIKSVLTPGGPVYETLARCPLQE